MSSFINEQYSNLEKVAEKYKASYAQGNPFPNIFFKDFFDPLFLDKVLKEFPDLSKGDSKKHSHENAIKLASKGENGFGESAKQLSRFLNSQRFLEFLKELTSIERDLIPDPYFFGGGYHEIKKGGFLKIHADFNRHDSLKLDRRLNVLIYLNKDWKDEYGGYFELWNESMTKCEKKIPPNFNTMAIFSTTDFSYHGHPDPLNCPEDRSRKSFALYYYTNGRPAIEVSLGLENHSTLYKQREGNIEDKPSLSTAVKKLIKKTTPPIIMDLVRKIK